MKTVDINQARKILLQGGVVAIPTETVYGLAGWIQSEVGLAKIFSTKERPFFDPLIVHVDSIQKAKLLTTNWTVVHEALAKACWPGPLTLIAKRSPSIHPLITSGLDSVGLRCPKHGLTLSLLEGMDGGLAAPSANKFGKTSPSVAAHVFEEFGDSVPILDGGPCEVGIESTVVGIEEIEGVWKVHIYRPGFYTSRSLKMILEEQEIKAEVDYAQSPVAPGQLKHHYMPNIPLVITCPAFEWRLHKGIAEKHFGKSFSRPAFWELPPEPELASRVLYEDLRRFSTNGHDLILISRNSTHTQEEWLGIWNRLTKAKSLEVADDFTLLE